MKWGVIGTRGYAKRAAAPGIGESSTGELVAVLGRDSERTADFAAKHDASAHTELDEFLQSSGLEAVWIVTPTFLHHSQALAALDAGKHVLLEKPLAASSEQAWELVEAARRAGRLLATGYQGRQVPGHQKMRTLISDGVIGDVTVARTFYGVHRPGPPPQWRQRRDQARWGALADIGTHHLDLLRMLLGEVSEMTALTTHRLGFETEDAATACLRFESGALATLTASVNTWKGGTRVEVHGTKGTLVAVDTNPAGAGTVSLINDEGERDLTGERRTSVWSAQVDAIEDAASGRNAVYASGEDGARNVEILERLG